MPLFDSAKGDIAYNNLPNTTSTNFGSGGLVFPEEGNLLRLVQAGTSPASTGGDYVMAVFSIPGLSYDIAGRGLNVVAMGSFVSNTNTKTVKIIYAPATAVVGSLVSGGTTIASGSAATALTSGGWILEANIFKYGILGSNTQLGLHAGFQSGNAVGALLAPSALTATESGAILIAVTVNSATTASDTLFNFFEINAMN